MDNVRSLSAHRPAQRAAGGFDERADRLSVDLDAAALDIEALCVTTFGGSWVAWLMRRAADVATDAGQGRDVRPALRLLVLCARAWERDLDRAENRA